MGFGRGKGFSPVIPPVEPPEPGYWTNDCQPTQDAAGGFCQYWNVHSQIFAPDHSYKATGMTLMLSQEATDKKGPLVVKIERLAANCWEGEVLWSKALYSTDLPLPTVYSSTYFPLPNLALENSVPYRIVVHTTPGWYSWVDDEWVEDENVAAINWRYKGTTNPYPRGNRWYGCNYRDESGIWTEVFNADQAFCIFGETDPTIKHVDLEVVASTDDCYTNPTTIRLTYAYLYLDFATEDLRAYTRFLAVLIPPGATILHAFISLRCYGGTGVPSNLRVRGIKEPNTATFSTKPDADGRAVTDAYKDWAAGKWLVPLWYGRYNDPCNLTAIIQEIIDQPTWASGNALAIKIINTTLETTRQCYAWDSGPGTYPPKLHIAYRE